MGVLIKENGLSTKKATSRKSVLEQLCTKLLLLQGFLYFGFRVFLYFGFRVASNEPFLSYLWTNLAEIWSSYENNRSHRQPRKVVYSAINAAFKPKYLNLRDQVW